MSGDANPTLTAVDGLTFDDDFTAGDSPIAADTKSAAGGELNEQTESQIRAMGLGPAVKTNLLRSDGLGIAVPELVSIIIEYATDFVGWTDTLVGGNRLTKGLLKRPSGLLLVPSIEVGGKGDDKAVAPGNQFDLVICDAFNNKLKRYSFVTDVLRDLAGSGQDAIIHGHARYECALSCPTEVQHNPKRAGCLYIGDWATVRHYDATTETVSLVAGGTTSGYCDGVGAGVLFNIACGLAPTADGKKIYVTDNM